MKEFFLASGNAHKAAEFAELLDSDFLKVAAAPDKVSVVEDGENFQENAFKKAEAYFLKYNKPVLSDDSGLVVDSLPGELGIHSARFGGEGLNDQGRCRLLLKKLEGKEKRSAYFVCVLCFYLSPEEIYFFEGRCFGDISQEIRKEDGFGYDPVFLPEGLEGNLSFSENLEWKMKSSHRAKAANMALKFFSGADEKNCQF